MFVARISCDDHACMDSCVCCTGVRSEGLSGLLLPYLYETQVLQRNEVKNSSKLSQPQPEIWQNRFCCPLLCYRMHAVLILQCDPVYPTQFGYVFRCGTAHINCHVIDQIKDNRFRCWK